MALLVHSLRTNGALYNRSPYTVMVVGRGASREDTLASNVGLRVVPQVEAFPSLNKMRMLTGGLSGDAEYLVMMDHDMLVCDLSRLEEVLGGRVLMAANKKYKLAHSLGKGYDRVMSEIAGRAWKRVDYFNAGITIVPREHVESLRTSWEEVVREVAERYDMAPMFGKAPFCNLTMSLALAVSGIPYGVLPDTYNQRNWRELPENPYILHYNNYDPDNVYAKDFALDSYESFEAFVLSTKNRFWKKYKNSFYDVLKDPGLISLRNEIANFIVDSRS